MIKLNFNFPLQKKSTTDTKENQKLSIFRKKGLSLVLDYMNNSDYHEHRALIREVLYLMQITYDILKDDYEKGEHILYENFPRIDTYVFSHHRKNDNLKENINKLLTLSFSNRFSEDPKQNLMSYYVFLEDIGFEVSLFFNDYYHSIIGKKKIAPIINFQQENYQLILEELKNEGFNPSPLQVNKMVINTLINKDFKTIKF